MSNESIDDFEIVGHFTGNNEVETPVLDDAEASSVESEQENNNADSLENDSSAIDWKPDTVGSG